MAWRFRPNCPAHGVGATKSFHRIRVGLVDLAEISSQSLNIFRLAADSGRPTNTMMET